MKEGSDVGNMMKSACRWIRRVIVVIRVCSRGDYGDFKTNACNIVIHRSCLNFETVSCKFITYDKLQVATKTNNIV